MRRWAIAVVAVLGAAMLPGPARAQCAVGCISSSDCGGTGRAGCLTTCDGDGNCICGDRKCDVQITAVVPSPEAVRLAGQSRTEQQPFETYLVTDCRGGVVGVRLTDAAGRAVQLVPAEILLGIPEDERSAGRPAVLSAMPSFPATAATRRKED